MITLDSPPLVFDDGKVPNCAGSCCELPGTSPAFGISRLDRFIAVLGAIHVVTAPHCPWHYRGGAPQLHPVDRVVTQPGVPDNAERTKALKQGQEFNCTGRCHLASGGLPAISDCHERVSRVPLRRATGLVPRLLLTRDRNYVELLQRGARTVSHLRTERSSRQPAMARS